MSGYVVTGPLAIVRGADGKLRYCYRDAVLPENLADGEAERLVAAGLVAAVDAPKAKPARSKPAAEDKG